MPYLVVASANMHTKPNFINLLFAHEGLGFIQDRLVEGKEVYDFCFILDEEFVETDTPTFYQNVFMTGNNSCISFNSLFGYVIEIHCSYQSPLGSILGRCIGKEVVPTGVAYLEILVFIAETHGYALPAMLTCPGVNMSILQDIVAHASFVCCENHFFLL